MKPATSGVKLTWDDYMRFPEDGKRHELIDGEHFVTPAPILRHQAIVRNISGLIWSHLRTHPVGRVFAAPMDVILSRHDVVEPDVLYFSHERATTFEASPWVKGAPNLVVEVASPGTRRRDETAKRRLYEKFGVDEYWLVEPADSTIVVLRLEQRAYFRAAHLRLDGGDVLTTPLLAGLELPLRDVFAE
ncbi:MAG TPA: Uma2 family endonuclease [Vicinamibacterales bacterium]|nr:Uma2 family endonuclease [Vicinamibacterales bacterium]